MSQEKVDRYKEQKANRKQEVKKEKIKHTGRKAVIGVLGCLLVVWIGYSAYDLYQSSLPREKVAVNYDAVNQYAQGLSATEEESETAAEGEETGAEEENAAVPEGETGAEGEAGTEGEETPAQ